jgi:hypothetical protein
MKAGISYPGFFADDLGKGRRDSENLFKPNPDKPELNNED